jgi:hypothetical protein
MALLVDLWWSSWILPEITQAFLVITPPGRATPGWHSGPVCCAAGVSVGHSPSGLVQSEESFTIWHTGSGDQRHGAEGLMAKQFCKVSKGPSESQTSLRKCNLLIFQDSSILPPLHKNWGHKETLWVLPPFLSFFKANVKRVGSHLPRNLSSKWEQEMSA